MLLYVCHFSFPKSLNDMLKKKIDVPHSFYWKIKTDMADFCFFRKLRFLFRQLKDYFSNTARFWANSSRFFPLQLY